MKELKILNFKNSNYIRVYSSKENSDKYMYYWNSNNNKIVKLKIKEPTLTYIISVMIFIQIFAKEIFYNISAHYVLAIGMGILSFIVGLVVSMITMKSKEKKLDNLTKDFSSDLNVSDVYYFIDNDVQAYQFFKGVIIFFLCFCTTIMMVKNQLFDKLLIMTYLSLFCISEMFMFSNNKKKKNILKKIKDTNEI